VNYERAEHELSRIDFDDPLCSTKGLKQQPFIIIIVRRRCGNSHNQIHTPLESCRKSPKERKREFFISLKSEETESNALDFWKIKGLHNATLSGKAKG
jgi:hypothetical protein